MNKNKNNQKVNIDKKVNQKSQLQSVTLKIRFGN